MKQIIDSYKKTGRLHHAYAILGDKNKIKEEITSFLVKDLKFPINNNPDFVQSEFNVFKIADSRILRLAHLNKPIKYERKIFLIFTNFITKDAQNSLLKILEEPSANSTFFFILPSLDLLETLKSRMIFGKGISKGVDSDLSAVDFLKAKIGKRLEIVARIVKEIKDEKITKSDAITFIKNLERVIKDNWKAQKTNSSRDKGLLAIEDIEKAISYACDESPSIKVILEHLAMVL
jgi:DNA polymerase III delta prime subunit